MKTRPGGAMTSEAYLKSFADDDHEDKKEKKRERGSQFARRYGNPVEIAFGQHVRVLLALVVLAGFIAWQKQNASIYAQQGADLIGTSEDPVDIANQKKIDAVKMQTKDFGDISRPWRPLVWTSVAPVPAEVLKKFESEKEQIKVAPQNLDFRTRWLALLGTWNALFAAVVLGMSCMWASPKVGFAVLVAAGLTLFGHFLPLPMAGTLDPWQMVFLNINTAIAGAAVAFVAIFFLRDTITA